LFPRGFGMFQLPANWDFLHDVMTLHIFSTQHAENEEWTTHNLLNIQVMNKHDKHAGFELQNGWQTGKPI
jgi:hypothetical protein